MPTYPLAYRIEDFLRRQIAWADRVLSELDDAAEKSAEALESRVLQQELRQKEARDFAREYNGLSVEWQRDQDTTAEERARIRVQSERAQNLMSTLQSRFDAAQQDASQHAAQLRNEVNDLRRGGRSVTIYQTDTLIAPEFVDKKA